jgi:hypothetical protein
MFQSSLETMVISMSPVPLAPFCYVAPLDSSSLISASLPLVSSLGKFLAHDKWVLRTRWEHKSVRVQWLPRSSRAERLSHVHWVHHWPHISGRIACN